MKSSDLQPGEHIHVDLTAPLGRMVFPLLELIVFTGVCWMGLGYQAAIGRPDLERLAVLGIWLALGLWRFVLPLWKLRREIFRVTDHRLIVRGGAFGARLQSIPLSAITHIERKRSTLHIWVGPNPQPLSYYRVPRAKLVQNRLEHLVAAVRPPVSPPTPGW